MPPPGRVDSECRGDKRNTDPLLDPAGLVNNGGPTSPSRSRRTVPRSMRATTTVLRRRISAAISAPVSATSGRSNWRDSAGNAKCDHERGHQCREHFRDAQCLGKSEWADDHVPIHVRLSVFYGASRRQRHGQCSVYRQCHRLEPKYSVSLQCHSNKRRRNHARVEQFYNVTGGYTYTYSYSYCHTGQPR
jgi:hypothetical protein